MSYLRFSLPGAASQTAASAATAAGQELKTDFPSVDDVLIMFERIVAQFMLTDMPRGEAERRALPVLRGTLRNDPRLAPRQVEVWRCLICGEPRASENGLLPYLSAVPGQHHWIHAGACHDIHCRQQSDKVETCLMAAGLSQSRTSIEKA